MNMEKMTYMMYYYYAKPLGLIFRRTMQTDSCIVTVSVEAQIS